MVFINLEISIYLLNKIKKYLLSKSEGNKILKDKWYYEFLEKYYNGEMKILFILLFPFSLISNYYYLNQDLKEIKIGKFNPHKREIVPFLWLFLTFFSALFIFPLIVSIRFLLCERTYKCLK